MPQQSGETPLSRLLVAAQEVIAEKAVQEKEGVASQSLQSHEQLIELCGRNGKGGIVARLKNDVQEISQELKIQRSLIMRLMLAMATASMVGAGIAHALLQAL